jgi:hypothetical protein
MHLGWNVEAMYDVLHRRPPDQPPAKPT